MTVSIKCKYSYIFYYFVTISSANLECRSEMYCCARGSLEMQDPKNHQKFDIWAPSHNFVGLYLRN